MRLIELVVVEDPDIESIAGQISRDCQPFLNEIDSDIVNHSLYRGMTSVDVSPFGRKKAYLRNRLPLTADERVHIQMNTWFRLHFGKPWRNGVFASGQKYLAGHYGDVYAIFPIGKFEYLWNSKVEDMFNLIMVDGKAETIPEMLDEIEPYFHKDNLKSISGKSLEIMVWCESYYYLDIEFRGILDKVGKFLQ